MNHEKLCNPREGDFDIKGEIVISCKGAPRIYIVPEALQDLQ
jgi:hypothetical protein